MLHHLPVERSIAVRHPGPHPLTSRSCSAAFLRSTEACLSVFRLSVRSNTRKSIARAVEARCRVPALRPEASKSHAHSAWAARHAYPARGPSAFASRREPKRDNPYELDGAMLTE